jgi:hypothetical protein
MQGGIHGFAFYLDEPMRVANSLEADDQRDEANRTFDEYLFHFGSSLAALFRHSLRQPSRRCLAALAQFVF